MKRNKTLEAMITPWEKLAKILSRNYGVEVRAEGFQACFDGKVIRLPSVLGDSKAGDEGFVELVRGVCDHEIGHAIEEQKEKARGRSTFDLFRRCKNKREKGLLNAIEDVRSERASAEAYPGMGVNIARIHEWAERYNQGRATRGELLKDPWHTLDSAIYLAGQERSVDWLPEVFKPAMETIADEIEEAKRLTSAEGSFDLMKRILTKLADMKDDLDAAKEEAERNEDEGEGKKEGASSEGEKTEGEESSEGEPADGDGSGEESSETGSEETTSGESTPSPSGEADRPVTGDPDPHTPTSEDSPRPFSDMSDEDREELSDLFDALEHTEPESTDVLDALKDKIESKSKFDAHADGRYVPDPKVKARDRFVKPKIRRGQERDYQRAKNTVRKQISGLRSRLLQILRARSQGRVIRDQERGDLDTSVLYSLKAGNTRIFRQTVKGEVIDTAVSILIDQSGSMQGSKEQAARLSAVALGESLDALGIPFEILGFDNFDAAVSSHNDYDRWLPLNMDVFKAFGEQYKRTKARLMNIQGEGHNTDGEAVYYAAERLARRPEARKILFVMSDGVPFGGGRKLEAHLRDTVTMITKAGIEVFGIGILTDAVREFYNKRTGADSIVINNIDELATTTFRVLRDKLLKRAS